MKKISLKKVFYEFLILALISLASLSFVACKNKGTANNSSTQKPQEQPLIFDDCFGLESVTTYTQTNHNPTSIDELKNFAIYKSITLYTKKEFSFNHFSFKLQAQNKINSAFGIYLNIYLETPTVHNSSDAYNFTNNEEKTFNFYYRRITSTGKYFFSPNKNSGTEPSTLEKMKLAKGDKISLTFKLWNTDTSVSAEYQNPIRLYDFFIE